MIAVQHSYQLSYQASLELLVFVWIQTYFQERQTKIMCIVFFFILRVHVTIIVISIFGKKKKERLFYNFSDLLDRLCVFFLNKREPNVSLLQAQVNFTV